jgi:hypothetical protein
LLDLLCCFPCGRAACDLHSGSGLTANRKNLPNASELYLAFDWVSRSSRPALCYRPLLAFPTHFAMLRVTALEPRTPHQPEKLKKLSKNDLVVLLLFLESMKRSRLYLIYFQRSAGRPQAGDRILCKWRRAIRAKGKLDAGFRHTDKGRERRRAFSRQQADCENLAKDTLGTGSELRRHCAVASGNAPRLKVLC